MDEGQHIDDDEEEKGRGPTSDDAVENRAAWPRRQIQTFEDLDVWRVCRKFRAELAQLARSFPKEEKFRLTDQLLRASRSVTANLAGGYGRFHYSENVQFARQARGSLYETLDHLTVAFDEGLIDARCFESHRANALKAAALINGFIRYLSSQKRPSVD